MKFKKIISIGVLLPVLLMAGKQVSLEKCRELALERNKGLKSVSESHRAQSDLSRSALKDFLPSLSFDGNYTKLGDTWRYQTPELSLPIYEFNSATGEYEIKFVKKPDGTPLINPETGKPVPQEIIKVPSQEMEIGQRDNYLLNLRLTQPVFTGGKILQKYKISKHSKKIAQAQMQLKHSEVIYRTDYYYWNICAIQEQVKLAKQYKKMIESHLEDVKNFRAEGLATQNDVLKIEVKKNEAESKLLKAQNALKLAKMALCQHIGLPLKADISPLDSLTTDARKIKYNSVYTDQALQSRPEINMLEQKLNINSAMVDLAWSRYSPNIYLTANYFSVNPNPYNSLKDEFGTDWSLGLVCEFPLFNWNKRGNQLTSARHKRKSASYELEEGKDKIKLEVQRVINKLNEAIQTMEMNKKSLQQSRENLKIAKDNFHEGIINSSELLEAQTLWRKSYANYIESKKSYKIARAKFEKVLARHKVSQGDQ